MGSLIGRGFNGPITRDDRSEPSMITPGQTLENPVTGERFTFTHTAATTGGELLAFELALRPGASVPIPHVHPIQTERFEVLEGTMRFRVGWRHRLARAGDVVKVAPGVMHGFANVGDHEARLRVEVRPALAMEDMFAEVIAMAEAGRMTSRGLPRNPLELADLARRYDQEAHAPLLSVGVQRLLLAPFVHYRPRGWRDSGRSSSRFASTPSSRSGCPTAPSARRGSPAPA